eukprot:1805985-Rhodomonas_salina.1
MGRIGEPCCVPRADWSMGKRKEKRGEVPKAKSKKRRMRGRRGGGKDCKGPCCALKEAKCVRD